MKTFMAGIRILRKSMAIAFLLCAAISLVPEALADNPCTGHQLLPKPRPEGSCKQTVTKTIVSPDKEILALIVPVGVSLYATPDIESRVVFRAKKGDTLASQDYSSPRGTNGYYVHKAKWSPDSQFFAFSMISSGGHSPWSFPIMVYSRKKNAFLKFVEMTNGSPSVSGDFQFSGKNTLTASTWKQPGDTENKVPVAVDLEKTFGK